MSDDKPVIAAADDYAAIRIREEELQAEKAELRRMQEVKDRMAATDSPGSGGGMFAPGPAPYAKRDQQQLSQQKILVPHDDKGQPQLDKARMDGPDQAYDRIRRSIAGYRDVPTAVKDGAERGEIVYLMGDYNRQVSFYRVVDRIKPGTWELGYALDVYGIQGLIALGALKETDAPTSAVSRETPVPTIDFTACHNCGASPLTFAASTYDCIECGANLGVIPKPTIAMPQPKIAEGSRFVSYPMNYGFHYVVSDGEGNGITLRRRDDKVPSKPVLRDFIEVLLKLESACSSKDPANTMELIRCAAFMAQGWEEVDASDTPAPPTTEELLKLYNASVTYDIPCNGRFGRAMIEVEIDGDLYGGSLELTVDEMSVGTQPPDTMEQLLRAHVEKVMRQVDEDVKLGIGLSDAFQIALGPQQTGCYRGNFQDGQIAELVRDDARQEALEELASQVDSNDLLAGLSDADKLEVFLKTRAMEMATMSIPVDCTDWDRELRKRFNRIYEGLVMGKLG